MATTARHRLLAATALGGVLALGGCTFTNPIETLRPYAASDGARLEVAEGIRLENVLVLTEDEGEEGRLYGAAVNGTDERVEITISFGESGETSVTVDADDLVNFTDEEITLDSTPAPPGATVEATVSTPEHGTMTLPVPVLDGTIPPYDEYLPGS